MAETADTRIVTTDNDASPEDGEDKKLFDELSFSTVIASALAAITSFLLQSQIGLTGSLIGVGVAAAASALASQVYKSVLSASASKIKDNLTLDSTSQGDTKPHETYVSGAGMTRVRQRPIPSWQEDDADKTAVTDGSRDLTGARIAPDTIRGAVAKRRSNTVKRRAAIFTAVVAIVAVLVYAVVVTVATQGRGIGSTPTVTESSPDDGPSARGTTGGTRQTPGTGTTGGRGNATPDAGQNTGGGTTTDTGSGTTGSTGETSEPNPVSSTTGTSGSTDSSGNTGTSGNATDTGTSNSSSNSSSGTGTSGSGSSETGTSGSDTGSSGSGTSDSGSKSSDTGSGSQGSSGSSTGGSGSSTTSAGSTSPSGTSPKVRPSSAS